MILLQPVIQVAAGPVLYVLAQLTADGSGIALVPVGGGMERYGHFVGPSMAQISEVTEFGRRVVDGSRFFNGPRVGSPLIAVHCEHGKSRSASVALALLANHLGDGQEHEAVNMLLRDDVEKRMHPIPLVIGLSDNWLLPYGRINAALTELSPRYAQWCELWRNIVAEPEAYWDKARRILSKRSGEG